MRRTLGSRSLSAARKLIALTLPVEERHHSNWLHLDEINFRGHMRRELEPTTRFRRDLKRVLRTDPSIQKVLEPILGLLMENVPLPVRLKDHPLKGEWSTYRDLHVKPDLVLIYKKTDTLVLLERLGSHAELFE
jgi:mRNA interferase YafQ